MSLERSWVTTGRVFRSGQARRNCALRTTTKTTLTGIMIDGYDDATIPQRRRANFFRFM